MKKVYTSPTFEIIDVYMEESIAAGSALVLPQDGIDHVQEQWTVDNDDSRIINW